ncbi:MAG: chromate transporter [Opitutaceae bacterium]
MKSLPVAPDSADDMVNAPAEPYGKLFLRFLRFGLLAWGGPVAQIDMVRQELVVQEKWISPGHFKRLLAIYQVLPGPEAHELCVHFGMLARGRWGGVLAMTFGIFLPAFGFSLLFHRHLTAVVAHPLLKHFLEGVTAAVVGLIAITTITLAVTAVPNLKALAIFVGALIVLYRWKSKFAIPALIVTAGIGGAMLV